MFVPLTDPIYAVYERRTLGSPMINKTKKKTLTTPDKK